MLSHQIESDGGWAKFAIVFFFPVSEDESPWVSDRKELSSEREGRCLKVRNEQVVNNFFPTAHLMYKGDWLNYQ